MRGAQPATRASFLQTTDGIPSREPTRGAENSFRRERPSKSKLREAGGRRPRSNRAMNPLAAAARRPRVMADVDMTSVVKDLWELAVYMGVLPETRRLREEAEPAVTTVDPADIRGLVTTLLDSVRRLPLSRHEGRPKPPLNAVEGCAKPGPRLFPEDRFIPGSLNLVSCLPVYLSSDRPHEGGEFAGDSGDDDVGLLASSGQAAESLAEPDLRFPSDVVNGLGEFLEPFLDVFGDLGRVTVGPGAFHEGAAGMGIATFGDPALAPAFAGGVFAGGQTQEGGELSGRIEASQVSELGDGVQAPAREELREVFFDPLQPLGMVVDCPEILLEDDLLRRGGTDDAGEKATVRVVPVATAQNESEYTT
jgi:hypothetical protein